MLRSTMEIAQAAYEGYAEKLRWTTSQGYPMLPWVNLHQENQEAWEAAACAALDFVTMVNWHMRVPHGE
jgi:hypothetical protein